MAPHRAHPDVLSMSGIDVPVMSSADVEISISIQTPSIFALGNGQLTVHAAVLKSALQGSPLCNIGGGIRYGMSSEDSLASTFRFIVLTAAAVCTSRVLKVASPQIQSRFVIYLLLFLEYAMIVSDAIYMLVDLVKPIVEKLRSAMR